MYLTERNNCGLNELLGQLRIEQLINKIYGQIGVFEIAFHLKK